MSKRLSLGTLAFFCFMAGAGREASAQNFLMNSAETINRGNFKISLFPTVLFGEDDADDNWGVGSRFGYGFTDLQCTGDCTALGSYTVPRRTTCDDRCTEPRQPSGKCP